MKCQTRQQPQLSFTRLTQTAQIIFLENFFNWAQSVSVCVLTSGAAAFACCMRPLLKLKNYIICNLRGASESERHRHICLQAILNNLWCIRQIFLQHLLGQREHRETYRCQAMIFIWSCSVYEQGFTEDQYNGCLIHEINVLSQPTRYGQLRRQVLNLPVLKKSNLSHFKKYVTLSKC